VSQSGLISHSFTPFPGGKNPHIQTLLPKYLRRQVLFSPHRETLLTPDDDFLELAWSEDPSSLTARQKPIFILFHGLEGSFYSTYANGLMHAFAQKGWLAVMMHFRGCSGKPNLRARSYHSGETEDPRYFLQQLHQRFPASFKMATGISLGGNILANYLVQFAHRPLLDRATLISAPFDLASCANRINLGISKIYQRYLLNSLQANARKKISLLQQALSVSNQQIQKVKTLKAFDDLITAPLHGFSNADDYYRQCSALPKLHRIQLPTLIIHAKDDPFMDAQVIPTSPLPESIEYHLLDHGGHVGFISGHINNPRFWLEDILPTYYDRLLI
jgi:predicted alpha/beta-fold hydrolase